MENTLARVKLNTHIPSFKLAQSRSSMRYLRLNRMDSVINNFVLEIRTIWGLIVGIEIN